MAMVLGENLNAAPPPSPFALAGNLSLKSVECIHCLNAAGLTYRQCITQPK